MSIYQTCKDTISHSKNISLSLLQLSELGRKLHKENTHTCTLKLCLTKLSSLAFSGGNAGATGVIENLHCE